MRFKLIFFLALGAFSLSYADDYRKFMNAGHKDYKTQKYPAAADQFNQAEVIKPEDPLAGFNNGTALYKSQDFARASEKFSQAAGTATGGFKSDAYYDLGNSLFKNNNFAGAMEAFKNALVETPSRTDAKFNYELTKMRLEQQQQQQQQQQDKNSDQDQQQQDQNQQQQDQKQQQQNQQNQQDKQEKQPQQQPQPEKGKMNQQEARELLNAFKEDEKQVQKELKKYQIRPTSKRDW